MRVKCSVDQPADKERKAQPRGTPNAKKGETKEKPYSIGSSVR